MWGVLWAPSTTSTAPCLWAMSANWRMGLTRPMTLETWVTATSFVRSVMRASALFRSRLPSGSQSRNFRDAPVWRHTICQGSRSL